MKVSRPRGSAKRASWHTVLMPEPEVFSEVSTTRHLGPGTTLTTCARLSSISSVTGFGAGSGSAAAAGFSTPPRTTNRPPASVRARSTTTPPTACTRRRRRPARATDGAGGSAVASAIGASSSMAARIPSAGVSVSLQKERFAASSWCSIRAALSPSSRPMPGVVKPARWASRKALRCWSGRWCRASSTFFCSALSPFSRCHSRATCRRCAIAHARGRTHSSGSGRRETLRQWWQAASNASRTALRAADRSPVSA